jgi:hypothetical protein
MAQTYDPRYFAALPSAEEGLQRIQSGRKKKAGIAATLFAVATVATLGSVYLTYKDTPAPQNPANAEPGVGVPYR